MIGPIERKPAMFTYDGVTHFLGFWYLTPETYGKQAHKSLDEAWHHQERQA